ncbi:MAG TPA: hypothetical protein DC038_02955 [Clostridiales bacterium]|nr:hypothetical protein [Clostridiales bacterium]
MSTSRKMFQEDSYLCSSEATVVSCVKKDDYYEVILDKTIFYPHMSGGQPKDEGTINGIEVFDVREEGNEIIHLLREPVEGEVSLCINFDVRFDYMQQHTGQHVLSCAFDELFNGKTIGFHLGDRYSTIDLDILVTDEIVRQVEHLSNKIIYENKAVTDRIYAYEDAIKLNLRKKPMELEQLRIVSIENYDDCACSGTHVKHTGEIGIIKVTRTEKYKGGTRVEFMCGKRALNNYDDKSRIISDLSTAMSCNADAIAENIERLMNENKKLKKDASNLSSRINEYRAEELKKNSEIKDGISYIFVKTEDDVKDLRFICSKITECENIAAVLVSEADNVCSLVMGQSKNLNIDLKSVFEECRLIIGGKGGGSSHMLQCSGELLKGTECIEAARRMLLI